MLAPTPQPSQSEADGKQFAGEFSPPVGHGDRSSGALCQVVPDPLLTPAGPGRILPGFVGPSLEPKPAPRRARGPRMEDGVNRAVLRAIAAGCRYLHGDDTLAEAARACNASAHYARAVVDLNYPDREVSPSDLLARRALLDAALDGDIALLTAAYETPVATNIVVITD